jgi:hypothetical protein
MAGKEGQRGCDARALKAEFNNQHAHNSASALQSQPKSRHGIVGFESDDAAAAWGVKLARDAKTFAARRPRRGRR